MKNILQHPTTTCLIKPKDWDPKRAKSIRIRLRMSQDALTKLIGMSPTMLCNYERGTVNPVQTYQRRSQHYIDWLINNGYQNQTGHNGFEWNPDKARGLRKLTGLTQKQLAIGITSVLVNHYETGKEDPTKSIKAGPKYIDWLLQNGYQLQTTFESKQKERGLERVVLSVEFRRDVGIRTAKQAIEERGLSASGDYSDRSLKVTINGYKSAFKTAYDLSRMKEVSLVCRDTAEVDARKPDIYLEAQHSLLSLQDILLLDYLKKTA